MRKLCRAFGIAVIMVALAQSAKATMIVIVYVKDGYWIGADSYRQLGGEHNADVCKVHETRFGLLVKVGNTQGATESGQQYSTDKEVEDIIRVSESLHDLKSKLRMQFQKDIEKEMIPYLPQRDVTPENLKPTIPFPKSEAPKLLRMIIMFDTKTAKNDGEVLLTQPESEGPFRSPNGSYYRWSARTALDWLPIGSMGIAQSPPPSLPFSYASSIHQFGYVLSYPQSNAWVKQHPKQAIQEILNQGHKEQPKIIGPPYVLVHVLFRQSNPPEVKWISKGVCPGWADTISGENNLLGNDLQKGIAGRR